MTFELWWTTTPPGEGKHLEAQWPKMKQSKNASSSFLSFHIFWCVCGGGWGWVSCKYVVVTDKFSPRTSTKTKKTGKENSLQTKMTKITQTFPISQLTEIQMSESSSNSSGSTNDLGKRTNRTRIHRVGEESTEHSSVHYTSSSGFKSANGQSSCSCR